MMYDIMGVTPDQLQKNLKQAQEKLATYNENSVDEARAKWHDARETLQGKPRQRSGDKYVLSFDE